MSTAVADVYSDVCAAVLESSGLTYVYSQANFLADLLVASRTMLESSPMVQNTFTVNGVAGTKTYTIPDGVGEVLAVFWNGKYLFPETGQMLDYSDAKWESESRTPEYWRMDLLAPETIQIGPIPTANGTITIIGTEQPTASSLSAGDNVPLVPDTIAVYLKYACLQKIWEIEGEGRDIQRAKYCRARLDELANVLTAVMDEDFREVA